MFIGLCSWRRHSCLCNTVAQFCEGDIGLFSARLCGLSINSRGFDVRVTLCVIVSSLPLHPGLCQIAIGQSDVGIAGGVDFMSDVPIRVSRGTRKSLLDFNKAKSMGARLGSVASAVRNFGLEVSVDFFLVRETALTMNYV